MRIKAGGRRRRRAAGVNYSESLGFSIMDDLSRIIANTWTGLVSLVAARTALAVANLYGWYPDKILAARIVTANKRYAPWFGASPLALKSLRSCRTLRASSGNDIRMDGARSGRRGPIM
jgi:hypothetical protein